jgi:probable rRNA maturation factor
MTKQVDKNKITVTSGKNGKSRERIEIELSGDRRLLLSFPEGGWGDLEIEAAVEGDKTAAPFISVQPGACNVLTLRVDVSHDYLPVEGEVPAAPTLNLSVQKAVEGLDRMNSPKKHQVRRWAQAAVGCDVEATVRLVGEAEGRNLNKTYRSKDEATNVLTFTYDSKKKSERNELGEVGERHGETPMIGDIVLCVPVVVREASEQGKPLDAHFAHLVVHGMLHLQGFDHKKKAEAEAMEAREREILRSLGYADPYA